jgi:hypothetical protein
MLFRVERDGDRSVIPDRAGGLCPHVGSRGAARRRRLSRARRCPGNPRASSRDEEIARRAFSVDFPGPRWCASLRLTMSRTAAERSRVVFAVCLEWPQAASGFLKSAATLPTVPVRALLAVPCGRRARSVLHVIMNRRGEVAIDRHVRMKSSYASRRGLSSDPGEQCQDSLETSPSLTR